MSTPHYSDKGSLAAIRPRQILRALDPELANYGSYDRSSTDRSDSGTVDNNGVLVPRRRRRRQRSEPSWYSTACPGGKPATGSGAARDQWEDDVRTDRYCRRR